MDAPSVSFTRTPGERDIVNDQIHSPPLSQPLHHVNPTRYLLWCVLKTNRYFAPTSLFKKLFHWPIAQQPGTFFNFYSTFIHYQFFCCYSWLYLCHIQTFVNYFLCWHVIKIYYLYQIFILWIMYRWIQYWTTLYIDDNLRLPIRL